MTPRHFTVGLGLALILTSSLGGPVQAQFDRFRVSLEQVRPAQDTRISAPGSAQAGAQEHLWLGSELAGFSEGTFVAQRGADNWISLTQLGATNRAVLIQQGFDNATSLLQFGVGNVHSSWLIGDGNSLDVVQSGNGNTYMIENVGDGLQHAVSQIGDNLHAVQMGHVRVPFSITQKGRGMEIIVQHRAGGRWDLND